MARDDNDNDDGDAQRPWKKRREKGLRALSCPTMKGFASLQRALLGTRRGGGVPEGEVDLEGKRRARKGKGGGEMRIERKGRKEERRGREIGR